MSDRIGRLALITVHINTNRLINTACSGPFDQDRYCLATTDAQARNT